MMPLFSACDGRPGSTSSCCRVHYNVSDDGDAEVSGILYEEQVSGLSRGQLLQEQPLEPPRRSALEARRETVGSVLARRTTALFQSLPLFAAAVGPALAEGGAEETETGAASAEQEAARGAEEPPAQAASGAEEPKRTSLTESGGRSEISFRLATHVKKAIRTLSEREAGEPSATELARGVHVEDIYDYWDLATGKLRRRKMQSDVLHLRRPAPLLSPRSEADDCSTESSGNQSPAASSRILSPPTSKFLKRTFTTSNTEVVTQWGAIVGKVLHSKVLDFTQLKDKTMRQRHIQSGPRVADPKQNRMGSRIQERAKLVVKQAVDLAKKLATEPDKFDGEWKDRTLLTYLFSTEYLDTLMLLTNYTGKVLSTQPTLAVAKVPCKIFGDIHGQLRDLLIYFAAFGNPFEDPKMSVVFNGDFVDRGAHQLEVIGVLFALKALFPDRVWLVRGNHEDRQMNERYGFSESCFRALGGDFGMKVFELIQAAFDKLPVACLVNGKILCVHGGIGDGTWRLDDLRTIPRPLTTEHISDPANGWIFNLLWSDPIEDGKFADPLIFGVHESPRGGVAAQFAWNVTKLFCARNGVALIVRSHQSKKGSLGFDVMHENMLVRVFSARDYEGHGNDGAVLEVHETFHGPDKVPCLKVRPQVVRSLTKANEENLRREQTEGATSEAAMSPRSSAPTPGKRGKKKMATRASA